jgi:hypothetical protein
MRRHSLRVALAAMSLVVVTAACTGQKDKPQVSGGVEQPADQGPGDMGPETTEPTTATTALRQEALSLAADGIGPLPFGLQAARAMNGLTQALGRAENIRVVPPAANCGVTRIFRWRDFDVLVNEASARSGGKPGLVGWSLGPPSPSGLGLKTAKGIGIGSTVTAVKAAYGTAVTPGQGPNGPTLQITAPSGVITAELDGHGDAARVTTLRAGATCNA